MTPPVAGRLVPTIPGAYHHQVPNVSKKNEISLKGTFILRWSKIEILVNEIV